MQVLRSKTDPRWVDVALSDFDALLVDHAHLERKAATTALALISRYPDHPELVRRCAKLAQEEMRHFQQVHALILERGGQLGRDRGDPYAKAMMALLRADGPARRTDHLLVCGLIEARSGERLELLAAGLRDVSLKRFYTSLATAETGHCRLFVELAQLYQEPDVVQARLETLACTEAEIVAELPLVPRMH